MNMDNGSVIMNQEDSDDEDDDEEDKAFLKDFTKPKASQPKKV